MHTPKPETQRPAPAPTGKMRFVWHLGFPKTGTTSFQELNRQNNAAYDSQVIVFQKRTRTRALCRATQAYVADPDPQARRDCDVALRRILRKGRAWGYDNILVSDENLAGWVLFDETGHIFERMEKLVALIEEVMHDADNRFVFYTREMEPWLRSVHNQEVKFSGETRDWDTWRAAVPFDTDWEAQRQRLAAAVDSPVIFRDMWQDRREGRPLGAHILSLAGLDEDAVKALAEPGRQNASLPEGALHFMLEVNRRQLPDTYTRIVRRIVLENPGLFSEGEDI